jgi:putative DNA-invertase from lambdoid prophage Rac
MHTFLYARTSTTEQTIGHQRDQAERQGFTFDEVIEDSGESGVSTRLADRPGGRRMLDKVRRGDLVVVRWVDRLGRNYEDVTETIRLLMRKGVVIKTIINAMTFDGSTKDPMQMAVRDALIAFMAATAQAQAEATKEAQKAGIRKARETNGAATKYKGRKPAFGREQLSQAIELLTAGTGPSTIADLVGMSRASVYRIKADPAAMSAALAAWE